MKRSIDETSARFDRMSGSYDQDRSVGQSFTALRVVETAIGLADPDDTVLDVGTGTGAVALHVAPHVDHVVGIDVSQAMLERARTKASEAGIPNVTFREGRFRDPEASGPLSGTDLVTSSFAMHHLEDDEKREAFAELGVVLGDEGALVIGDLVIFDGEHDVDHYDPAVDAPSHADDLREMVVDAGFSAELQRLGPMTGLLTARR